MKGQRDDGTNKRMNEGKKERTNERMGGRDGGSKRGRKGRKGREGKRGMEEGGREDIVSINVYK